MSINNETLGQSAEKVICDLSDIDSTQLSKRANIIYEVELIPILSKAINELPKIIRHAGLEKGIRGGDSKSKIDFYLEGDKTLSVKTNKSQNTMVCAPEVGQASWMVLEKYYRLLLDENNIDHLDEENYRRLVCNSIHKFILIQLNHLFSCDYLLWIFNVKGIFQFKIIHKSKVLDFDWKFENFWSKKDLNGWIKSESISFRYNDISLINAQVHNHRNPPNKFRFNMRNLCKILNL
tara:strand:+ start:624 stop:1331 length:708 start_codon:yes stop_codon:yes gene_type:complete